MSKWEPELSKQYGDSFGDSLFRALKLLYYIFSIERSVKALDHLDETYSLLKNISACTPYISVFYRFETRKKLVLWQ